MSRARRLFDLDETAMVCLRGAKQRNRPSPTPRARRAAILGRAGSDRPLEITATGAKAEFVPTPAPLLTIDTIRHSLSSRDNGEIGGFDTPAVTGGVDAGVADPVVAATALVTLLLVAVAYEAVGALVTLAHEGAHALVNTVAGRRVESLEVGGGFSGVTRSADLGWGPGRILSSAAGYTAPPLLGLGGAALLAAGEVLLLLWTAVVLLVLAWIKAEKEWTTFLVLLLAVVIGYVAVYGPPELQLGVAAGLVWLLLLGGLRDAVESSRGDGSDAANLARDTLVPSVVWKAIFIAVALLSLWAAIGLLAP